MHEQTLMKQKDVKTNCVKQHVWHRSLLRSGPIALRSSWQTEGKWNSMPARMPLGGQTFRQCGNCLNQKHNTQFESKTQKL